MHTPALHPRRARLFASLSAGLAVVFVLAVPASAFDSGWTKPKRVFSHSSAPTHSMVTDESGRVHIATERGSTGVWYVTNASGNWTSCQVSSGDDRYPSIGVSGGVVHVAWTRNTDGQKGLYTSSSDKLAPADGCGWAITQRYAGGASHAALGVRGTTESIAFRTSDRKLKFTKGGSADPTWNKAEVIDGSCCTSPVALALTSSGAPRVAYGDGTSSAQGLKYAKRTAKGWKKSKVHGGRVKGVDLVLDQTPPLFGGPPSNSPKLAYVVKRKGLFVTSQGGGWSTRGFGGATGTPQISHHSNLTQIIYVRNGDLLYLRFSGGIWAGGKLSGAGNDSKPQFSGGKLTFSRQSGMKGVYFTQPK
jgi:hypothetical protein